MYVVKVQEAGLIRFKSADVVFEVNMATGKFTIKNSSTSLFEIIADLITEVKTLKVFTPSGPSGTALPLNVVRLNAIKTKLNTLLN